MHVGHWRALPCSNQPLNLCLIQKLRTQDKSEFNDGLHSLALATLLEQVALQFL